jgi:hypothetical protein
MRLCLSLADSRWVSFRMAIHVVPTPFCVFLFCFQGVGPLRGRDGTGDASEFDSNSLSFDLHDWLRRIHVKLVPYADVLRVRRGRALLGGILGSYFCW